MYSRLCLAYVLGRRANLHLFFLLLGHKLVWTWEICVHRLSCLTELLCKAWPCCNFPPAQHLIPPEFTDSIWSCRRDAKLGSDPRHCGARRESFCCLWALISAFRTCLILWLSGAVCMHPTKDICVQHTYRSTSSYLLFNIFTTGAAYAWGGSGDRGTSLSQCFH